MILQGTIKLPLEQQAVWAQVDFDTGLIGFTKQEKGQCTEYHYHEAPQAFRQALFKSLAAHLSEEQNLNGKISLKNARVKEALEIMKG